MSRTRKILEGGEVSAHFPLASGRGGSLLSAPRHRCRGHSSVGRALQWHCRGRRFDPDWLHQCLMNTSDTSPYFPLISSSPALCRGPKSWGQRWCDRLKTWMAGTEPGRDERKESHMPGVLRLLREIYHRSFGTY